jgi:hypothetical protein
MALRVCAPLAFSNIASKRVTTSIDFEKNGLVSRGRFFSCLLFQACFLPYPLTTVNHIETIP